MLRGRWLVLAFPVGLVLGLAIGVTTGQALPGRLADAGFMTLLGILLAAAIWLPSWMLVSLALALAIIRGAANAGGVGPTQIPRFSLAGCLRQATSPLRWSWRLL
ncbi:MAG: hypothetical protein ACJ8AI_23840 [Rhodopila sp.]